MGYMQVLQYEVFNHMAKNKYLVHLKEAADLKLRSAANLPLNHTNVMML